MKTYLVCIPTLPGTVLDELLGILNSCVPLWHGVLTERGNSSIALARNNMADAFLKGTKLDSIIWIDSDILFTREDFELLLEGPEPAVSAIYAKKDDSGEPAVHGMGFARTDRCVFDALRERGLTQEAFIPGWGRVITDYFINGAAINPQDPNGLRTWIGEDTGFWSLVRTANIPYRIETRTDLGHVGRKVYKLDAKVRERINPFVAVEPSIGTSMSDEEYERWRQTCDDMGSVPPPVLRSSLHMTSLESDPSVVGE